VITAAIRAGADCIPKRVKLHLAQFAHYFRDLRSDAGALHD
jgi:hypothetical protein